jgi:hypothetical protein
MQSGAQKCVFVANRGVLVLLRVKIIFLSIRGEGSFKLICGSGQKGVVLLPSAVLCCCLGLQDARNSCRAWLPSPVKGQG